MRFAKELGMRHFALQGLGFGLALSLGLFGGAYGQETGTAETGSSVAPASAGVRIVRLSAVRGKVELDRGTGRNFEPGFMNLPIVQGNRLRTLGLGWAEVEFEDGGSARITPDTQLSFDTLSRGRDGQVRSGLTLSRGTLYVSRLKGDKSDLVVTTGGKRIVLPADSHVRLDVYEAGSELVVVHGSVRVEDESGAATIVDRKQALKFGGTGEMQLVQAKGEAPGLYDRWDAQAAEYHNALMGGGVSGSVYGVRDLQYYGNYSTLDGCGRVWRPYLAGAGFDPAASGVWAWYPGSGYSFVSPYSWGWTTFNSGQWVSCGAHGWGWRPGAWIGLKNHPIAEPIRGPGHRPRPLEEPAAGKPTVVNVGEHELVRSSVVVDGVSRFQRDSAGLGVPRGLIENLKEISKAVEAGKTTPEPTYTARDLVAADPVALVLIAQRAGAGVRPGGGAGVRGTELASMNGRPIATALVAGRSGGGYAGGRSSFGGASVGSGGGSFSSGGGRSSGSSSSSASLSASAGSSAGASSMASSGGSSSGGGHK